MEAHKLSTKHPLATANSLSKSRNCLNSVRINQLVQEFLTGKLMATQIVINHIEVNRNTAAHEIKGL